MADEIITLLKNEKLRAEVIRAIKKVYDYVSTSLADGEEDTKGVSREELASSWEEAWLAAYVDDDFTGLEDAFQEYVIDRMSRPARITLDDLTDGFELLAKPIEYTSQPPDWESIYAVFLGYVENYLLSRKSLLPFDLFQSLTFDLSPFVSAFLSGLTVGKRGDMAEVMRLAEELSDREENRESDLSAESQRTMAILAKSFGKLFCWSSESGIEMRCSWGRAVGRWHHIVAEVEGPMSAAASESVQSEMSHLLRSIIRSVSLLEPFEHIAIPWSRSDYAGGLPSLDRSTLSDQKLFIHNCLDAFYSRATRKDSIDKRIHNAVCLLMESDARSNDALALALSVTAVEALLGRGSTNIAEGLSTDVAVLLEPDLDRRQAAMKFVKRIYGLRSDALHGKTTEGDEDARNNSRLLAAGILRAIVTRREFMRRAGFDPETPKELLEELREGLFQPGQTVGVDEPRVRKLWENA